MSLLIFCDIEATGNRKFDRIIQLGLILVESSIDTYPLNIFNELNFSDIDIMAEAMELHNITPNMLKDKKNLNETNGYKKLSEINNLKNIFIAHDAPSDIKMLEKEGFINQMMVIDTLKCTKHLFGHLNAYRLQFLRYKLELYKDEEVEAEKINITLYSHDALSDTLIMRLLLLKLIEEVKKQFSLTSNLKIFQKLIELSYTPVLLSKFPFGKYKGILINEVVNNDFEYVEWMRNTLKLDIDMNYTLDYYM